MRRNQQQQAQAAQFIAEVSSNHHQNLERCLQFVDVAAEIGCWAIKFQLFRIEELFAPQVLERSEKHRARVKWELPLAFLPKIAQRCQRRGILFGCTPFYVQAVEQLAPYVDFYKIASYELLWDDLIQCCAHTKRPLIMSTGLATLAEVQHAVNVARDCGNEDITLLHCVSSYPVPAEQCNLAAIATLLNETACKVGWSDHSVDVSVVYRALFAWQASVIEFHLDLDESGDEYQSGHCWLPAQIAPLIESAKRLVLADGSGVKQPAACELQEITWRADPSDGLRPLMSERINWRY